ncbi:hypothetical protein ALC57_18629 [Trachymyrmex cornetzi]|uniref:Uncharacterized protein n=1 Tax=Trachymyrmex cornetzi TaxID=471704 RepID=A0A151IRC2_9HYME|nr:hypothetical protein ALC57_18629 [Trachymyrmex cornetzi]
MVQTKFAGFREIYLMVTLNLTLRSTLGITQGQSTVLQIRVHRFLKIPNYQDLEQSMPPVSALPKMYHVEVTRSDLHLVGVLMWTIFTYPLAAKYAVQLLTSNDRRVGWTSILLKPHI